MVADQHRDSKLSTGLSTPSFLPRRYKPRNVGEWTGHLTFASDLIVALQPDLIVELGTHWGEAYFTFCQTVQEHGLSTLCYAVDHWQGDEHAGHYGEEVFEEVSQYNDRLYRQFSYLLRRSFDEARSQFAENSIDLLHIDGLHTYEAVAHDFRGWLPKVKPGGMIMMHDICPRHQDFGVWRLWEEIKAEFPDTFEFHHSWGLGVVRKSGGSHTAPLLQYLFESSEQVREDVRRHYVVYASHLEHLLDRMPSIPAPRLEVPTQVRVEVFPCIRGGYAPDFCQVRNMPAGSWHTLVFDLRYPDMNGPLRVDTGYEPSLVEIGNIVIHANETGEIVWQSSADSPERGLQFGGTALLHPNNPSFMINVGDDPNFLLIGAAEVRGSVTLTITLKVVPVAKAAMEIIHSHLQSALASTAAGLKTAEQDLKTAEQDKEKLEAKICALDEQVNQLTSARTREQLELNHLSNLLLDIQNSASWRVTSPMRKVMAALRRES